MIRAVFIVTLSASLVAGCGGIRDSRLNPFNWFGGSVSQPVAADGATNPLIPARRASIFRRPEEPDYAGSLVGEVTEMLIERRPGGAVVRATGVADYQGPYEVKLVKDEAASTDGALVYDLRAYQAPGPRNTALSRTVTAAVWLTDNELASVRGVTVKGARNQRVSRR